MGYHLYTGIVHAFIDIEAALVNPEITGTDTKSIRKPRIVEVKFYHGLL